MLETNHVRAACWLGKACAGATIRKKDEKEHAALSKPTPTNKPGRERQSMCYDEKMK